MSNKKTLVLSSQNLKTYGFIGDTFYNKSENYKIGIEKVNVDNTISFSNPTVANENYDSMINAEVLNFNTLYNGGSDETGNKWFKFITNVSSAHLNGGNGTYKINYINGFIDSTPRFYIYNTNNQLVASDVSGNLNPSFQLAFGQTYFLKVTTGAPAPFTMGLSYENVGGNNANSISKYDENSLFFECGLDALNKEDRIERAVLTVFQKDICVAGSTPCDLVVYYAENVVYPECVLSPVAEPSDCLRVRTAIMGESVVAYNFDITNFVKHRLTEELLYPSLVIKSMDSQVTESRYITVYGPEHSQYAPKVTVTYGAGYAVNDNSIGHTVEIGTLGQANIDLKSGNMMMDIEDFAYGGNRMPVTIKHIYNGFMYNRQYTADSSINLNTADFSAMKLGVGFKLNVMQSMVKKSDGNYVFIGEDGNEHLFKIEKEGDTYYTSENGGMKYYETERLLENGDDYRFDEQGRLISVTDEFNNVTTYTYTDNKLTKITDPVGREYTLNYNSSGLLTKIYAPDSLDVTYTYDGVCLTKIVYPSDKKVVIDYDEMHISSITLYDDLTPVRKTSFTFEGYNVTEVKEYGYDQNLDISLGKTTAIDYSALSNRTVVSTTDEPATVYVFNDNGELMSEYIDASGMRNAVNSGEENEEQSDSGFVSNISNNLKNHNFSSETNDWQKNANSQNGLEVTYLQDETKSKFGKHCLVLKTLDENAIEKGVCQSTATFGEGEYTFSAFVKVKSGFGAQNSGVYLRMTKTADGSLLAQSEKITVTDGEYVRIYASERLLDGMSVKVEILLDGEGEAYIDGAQFERNPAPSEYNMLDNGHFIRSIGDSAWQSESGTVDTEQYFGYGGALKLAGDINGERNAHQTVEVKSADNVRESFKLSGWAKGYAKPISNEEVTEQFALKAKINYTDETSCEETAKFSDYTKDWQFASVEFSKDAFKEIKDIEIFCIYNYNIDAAYFDNIELVRTGIETDLTADDFADETENETENEETTENATTEETTETEDTDGFEEKVDAFGNTLTETTFTEGEFGTIYRSFGFDEDGNHLSEEIDARGNVTRYEYAPEYSLNEKTTDREGNVIDYEYDEANRVTEIISKDKNGQTVARVSYGYDALDNLTEIVRGDGLKYVLGYTPFRNLQSIGIEGKTDGDLVTYNYKSNNGNLKEIIYANGDKMTARYNGYGQMIAETWTDIEGKITAKYKYSYDNGNNIVRTIDIKNKKMYNYLYQDGIISQSVESDILLNESEFVTGKTVKATVRYIYNDEGTLTKKRIISADGNEQIISYKTAENEAQLVKTEIGENSFVSTSKNDSFGRKEFDELQLGAATLSRRFEYLDGEITDQHKQNGLVKSSATTELISKITLTGGRTLCYEYDKEERITKVTDSVDGVSEYVYDALGQLISETKNGQAINTMTYDNYGNILSKNGISYSYDSVWKDKLTSVGNQSITYDAQGNPLNYRGHTLTWEKGRQLKSFDGIQYTYNANGIRTSKTVDSVRHDFVLDGAKILSERWGENTLIPLYDNEEAVCGIVYNGTAYYFQKNLQGDIIAICDKAGETVARYTYDAWGVPTIVEGSQAIATINPFRYRGYYYDSEIGMYYLQSRYYDPCVGRFVNGDDVYYLGKGCNVCAYNLFHYCENEPVCRFDPLGNSIMYIHHSKNFVNGNSKKGKGGREEKKANLDAKILKTKYSVYMYPVNSKKEFTHVWNNFSKNKGKLRKIDIVIIALHGSHRMVKFVDFASLKRRNIDTLILFSCYAGNANYYKTNPAYKFFNNNNIRQMVCSDGSVNASIVKNKVKYVSHRDVHMKKSLYLNRDSYGFFLYEHGKKKGWTNITEIGHEFKSIDKLLKAVGKW